MAHSLVIVESPTKARTISNYLGKEYETIATFGHVRDLAKKNAVIPDENFKMLYEPILEKKKNVDDIIKKLKNCDVCYLATDPDREGEAIAWHLIELLKQKKVLKNKTIHRVIFHEITQQAVSEALANPKVISTELIEAQQARRALDYLVGFYLSPLLWRKIYNGLSAGRVQSPALRMICEREQEVNAFIQQEYWQIEALTQTKDKPFSAHLTHYESKRLSKLDISSDQKATQMVANISAKSKGVLNVSRVRKQKRNRRAQAPYITSTLQQDAVKRLGFGTSRSMRIAQQLYEGVAINGQSQGLITYMRTDSVALAASAVTSIRNFIAKTYGQELVPSKPNVFKNSTRNAQEAHEAIRPTRCELTPAAIKGALTDEQFKLYDLIWKRTIACQMCNAVYEIMMIDLDAGGVATFHASASVLVEPGFTLVFDTDTKDQGILLPSLEEGEKLALKEIKKHQHFTEPPPRLNEASLVKALEGHGIGRPSTYATIVRTLVDRDYVTLESRRFKPTERGETVNRFLTEHFKEYTDYGFTFDLEAKLDHIAKADLERQTLMQEFWTPFKSRIDEKSDSVARGDTLSVRELGIDPKTKEPLYLKRSRFGLYVQIGDAPKDRKQKMTFIGIPSGIEAQDVDLALIEKLRKLPRVLGKHEQYGELAVNNGPFGPYVRYQNQTAKPQYAGLEDNDDIYSIDFDQATELVVKKETLKQKRLIRSFEGSEIQILNGRYGPYISDGKNHARIPKDVKAEELSLSDCLGELEKAKNKPKKTFRRSRSAKR